MLVGERRICFELDSELSSTIEETIEFCCWEFYKLLLHSPVPASFTARQVFMHQFEHYQVHLYMTILVWQDSCWGCIWEKRWDTLNSYLLIWHSRTISISWDTLPTATHLLTEITTTVISICDHSFWKHSRQACPLDNTIHTSEPSTACLIGTSDACNIEITRKICLIVSTFDTILLRHYQYRQWVYRLWCCRGINTISIHTGIFTFFRCICPFIKRLVV